VEHSEMPAVPGPPPVRPGRRGAAAGSLHTPGFTSVEAEFRRIDKLLAPDFQRRQLIAGTDSKTIGPGSPPAPPAVAHRLRSNSATKLTNEPPIDRRKHFDPAVRQQRQVQELERHVQRLVRASEHTREGFFPLTTAAGPKALESFTVRLPRYRQYLWEEVL